MARFAAQARACFYPAPPEAVVMVAARLRAPAGGAAFSMLDSCAGEGLALRQLSDLLGCRPEHRFLVELDEQRAEAARVNLPGSQVLGPASAFGVKVSYGAFSLLFLNPPFDDEFGGGQRTEVEFLRQATPWLKPGGVLCFVCPERVVLGYNSDLHFGGEPYTQAADFLKSYYEQVTVLRFPEEVRKFKEVVVLAVKRKEPVESQTVTWQDVQAEAGHVYAVPAGEPPARFVKTEPTETELRRMLGGSPLRKVLEVSDDRPLARPPLPVNAGHRAMLLAAGHLDGLVKPKREAAHVVRGTAEGLDRGLRTNHGRQEQGVIAIDRDRVAGQRVIASRALENHLPESDFFDGCHYSTLHQFRAVLQSNAKVKLSLRDLGVHVGWRHGARRHEGGYKVHRARLDANTWHVLAVAKDESLVVAATDEAVWQEFRSPRFTTPLLRRWVPWLRKKLEAERKLVYPRQCGCNVALLLATNEDLDQAVSEGVRSGTLKMEVDHESDES